MTSNPPKKRGRPPKNNSSASTQQNEQPVKPVRRGPPKKSTLESATPVDKTHRNTQLPSSKFFLQLKKSGSKWALELCDRKGKSVTEDYRQYTGTLRELLRIFQSEQSRQELFLSWEEAENDSGTSLIYEPTDKLLELALNAGVLISPDFAALQTVSDRFRIFLSLQNPAAQKISVSPVLVSTESEEEKTSDADGFQVVSPGFILTGDHLYRLEDVETETDSSVFSATSIKNTDIESYLSLMLSRSPQLGIRSDGYEVQIGKPRLAQAALLFHEIDAYGFLHVRPMVHLEGYPPGFFEDQEIIKVVDIDTEEKRIEVAEVVFPQYPAASFRSLLLSMGKGAAAAVYEESGYFILEPEFASRFLSENMSALLSQFVLLESKLLSRYKVKTVRPRLRLSLGEGIDYFEGTAQVDIEGEQFSFGRFMAEYRKSGYIVLNDGSRAYPEKKEMDRFGRLVSRTKGGDDEAVGVSFFDIPALVRDGDIEADGAGWKQAGDFFHGYNDIAKQTGDYSLQNGELRPYQEYGVKWLEYLSDHNMGACLADEMGLGKTVQVITLLRNAYKSGISGPTLVMAPRSLVYNWEAELERFAPDLPRLVYYGATRDATVLSDAGNTVVLSSYATIRLDIAALRETEFAFVVLDESQNIKNIETQTASAVLSLKARHRIALSGTPVENSLADLFSLFRFLNPSFFGSQAEFTRKYLRPIQENEDADALRDLKARVYPFMLRRVKRDVLADLPPKTEQTAYIELDSEHLAVYHRRRLELKERITHAVSRDGVNKSAFMILQALTELRRLAGVPEADGEYEGVSAKREYLKDMVGGIVAEGHKCLIFTNFLASVDLVSEDLAAAGIGNLVMTGATGDRQSLVRRFQSDPDIRAFIMTLKTGGVGLNLTAADYVFIFDPWWNRAAEAQAIDRTHRIGQTNPVFCYRMIARETIEEKILELQERKAGLVSSLLSSDAGTVKSLTEDDIIRLLS